MLGLTPEAILWIAALIGLATAVFGFMEKVLPYIIPFFKKSIYNRKKFKEKNLVSEERLQELIALFTTFLFIIKSGSLELEGIKKN